MWTELNKLPDCLLQWNRLCLQFEIIALLYESVRQRLYKNIERWNERKGWKEEQETTYFLKKFWHLNFEFPPFQLQHYHNIYFSMEVISWDMIWEESYSIVGFDFPGKWYVLCFYCLLGVQSYKNMEVANNGWIDSGSIMSFGSELNFVFEVSLFFVLLFGRRLRTKLLL